MKIALAQLNYHIGHFEKNEQLITNAITKAKAEKAELVVFSELCVCGYPPHDLLERKEFVEECVKSVERIATQCTDIAAIVGGPAINPNNKGKKLFNAAFFLNEGKIKQTFYKSLLPTYDVFDEYRYFEPNTAYDLLEYKGTKMAVTICEDIWENQPVANPFAQNRLYANSPMEKLIGKEPEIILNMASSPFSYVQEGTRKGVLRHNAEKYKIPVVYVNQVGANTELVFDGNSMVYNSDAELCIQCDRFVEDLQFVETDSLTPIKETAVEAEEDYHIPLIHDALVVGIKDYFGKMGFKQATLGLSGGIDSAVVVVLAVEALGAENVRVLLMPSQFSSDHSVEDAIGPHTWYADDGIVQQIWPYPA
jgi:NAD+ synthase (glutamine-hydrolysing)